MNFIKRNITYILIIWLLLVAALYARYSYTLSQSKKSAANIPNRAIIEQELLDEREDSADAIVYKQEQNEMQQKQEWIAQDIQKSQQEGNPVELANGLFNRLDPIHRAEWWVQVIEDGEDVYVILSSDFKTANGPDLFVILSNSTQKYEQDSLNLWALTSLSGKQVYKVTKEERETYNWSLQIRCRAFDVLFSVAELG